ncbi:hypothetical protein ACXZ9C_11480 [Streptococcus agalactiae]
MVVVAWRRVACAWRGVVVVAFVALASRRRWAWCARACASSRGVAWR